MVSGIERLAHKRELPRSTHATVQRVALRLLSFANRRTAHAETVWVGAACAVLACEAIAGVPASPPLLDDLGFAVPYRTLRDKHLPAIRSALAAAAAELSIPLARLQSLELVLDADECLCT